MFLEKHKYPYPEHTAGEAHPDEYRSQGASDRDATVMTVATDEADDTTQKIAGVEERIAKLFEVENREKEAAEEMVQMKRASRRLRKIDGKLNMVNAELGSKMKWFGKTALMEKQRKLFLERKSLVQENFTSVVERFSLNPRTFFRAVERGGRSLNFTERLLETIDAIKEIEAVMPGACQRLAENYGIQNFARYPTHMLLEQLRNEDDTETPYGVALYSQNDWNGAITDTSKMDLEELDEETKKAGLRVRIIEGRGLISTAKRLITLDKKYGQSQKIQFAVIAGHGSEESVELGDSSLETEAFPENAMKKIGDFFAEKPTIILHACSTGKNETGIAHILASTLNAEVIGSNYQITGLDITGIKKTDEGYKFEMTFQSPSLLGMWTRREKPKSFRKDS